MAEMTVFDFVFYMFSTCLLVGGALTVVSKSPVHSVLWMILSFLSGAGLMVLLGAEFVAMLLIIVYVGAVMVLFLFVVMMLDVDFAELRAEMARFLPLASLIGIILLIAFIPALFRIMPKPYGNAFRNSPIPRTAASRMHPRSVPWDSKPFTAEESVGCIGWIATFWMRWPK